MQFGIMSIPTVILFREGREERRIVGVQPKEVYMQAIAPAPADGVDPEKANLGEVE
jgi:thioredoxin-like negative regulator of GroEL